MKTSTKADIDNDILYTEEYRHCGSKFPELKSTPLDFIDGGNYNIETNCHLIYYYFINPNFRQRLIEMGIITSYGKFRISEHDAYYYLAKNFLKASDFIEDVVQGIRSSWNSNYTIGLHVRAGDKISFDRKYSQGILNSPSFKWSKYARKIVVVNKARELTRKHPEAKWYA